MSAGSDVRAFKLVVRSDGTITAMERTERDHLIGDYQMRLDPVHGRTIEVLVQMLREGRLQRLEEYQLLGECLYAVLFMDSEGRENRVGEALLRAVNEETNARLRVELEFHAGQERLASWPWEYLRCPLRKNIASGYFLATLARLVLARHLRLHVPPRPVQVDETELPLRILFVAASPEEEGLPPVQYKRILEEIEELAKSPRITVSKLIPPDDSALPPVTTFENFWDAIFTLEPHVIHFVGHGHCAERGGQLALMGLDRTADWMDEDRFANLLRQIHSVRLVLLQASESALPGSSQAISEVAMRLASVNIPAVVAVQYPMQQMVAGRFARAFYTALLGSEIIDAAVQIARSSIWARVRDWDRSRTFGLPVLWQREPGALLSLRSDPRPSTIAPDEGLG